MSAWSESTGAHGITVSVYERTLGGPLYIRHTNGSGTSIRRSLKHRDKARARSEAQRLSLELQAGQAPDRIPDLGTVLSLYHEHRVSRLCLSTRARRERQRTFWLTTLGPSGSPLAVTREVWERVSRDRLLGEVDASGGLVEPGAEIPCTAGTVNQDLKYLKSAFRWAATFRTDDGSGRELRYLLPGNPLDGLAYCAGGRPRRPVATIERFKALRAQQVGYLPEVLDVCMGTNRRISAVAALRFSDIRWTQDQSRREPFGAIVWPAETDKVGHERRVPMTPMVRAALDRARAYEGQSDRDYVFPAPAGEGHVTRSTLWRWLRKAEEAAGLEHLEGGGFHQFRRLWATRRKHLSDIDAAEAGGWQSQEVLRMYQQSDPEAILETMIDPEVERLAMGAR